MKLTRDTLELIQRYIEDNLSTVTEEDIAREFHISRCYVSVLFKKSGGGIY